MQEQHKCDQCSFSTVVAKNLTMHIERHHIKKLYKCDQCSYQGNPRSLVAHIRNIHDNLWFNCDECDYKSSQKCSLKVHTQTKHEGIIHLYSCDQCGHQSRKKQNALQHNDQNSERLARPGTELRVPINRLMAPQRLESGVTGATR